MIKETKLSRRNLLKGAAATAAFAGGSTLGAPMIWAQNIKDVTLRQIGTGVSNLNEIAEKVKEDLGFNLTMTALDTDSAAQRVAWHRNWLRCMELHRIALICVASYIALGCFALL